MVLINHFPAQKIAAQTKKMEARIPKTLPSNFKANIRSLAEASFDE
jgi:hypothetical protein